VDSASIRANAAPVPPPPTVAGQRGILLTQDFNGAQAWSGLSSASTTPGITATAALQAVGTVDVAHSTAASGAALLTVSSPAATSKPWSAAIDSGLLPVRNTVTDLGKLTL